MGEAGTRPLSRADAEPCISRGSIVPLRITSGRPYPAQLGPSPPVDLPGRDVGLVCGHACALNGISRVIWATQKPQFMIANIGGACLRGRQHCLNKRPRTQTSRRGVA